MKKILLAFLAIVYIVHIGAMEEVITIEKRLENFTWLEGRGPNTYTNRLIGMTMFLQNNPKKNLATITKNEMLRITQSFAEGIEKNAPKIPIQSLQKNYFKLKYLEHKNRNLGLSKEEMTLFGSNLKIIRKKMRETIVTFGAKKMLNKAKTSNCSLFNTQKKYVMVKLNNIELLIKNIDDGKKRYRKLIRKYWYKIQSANSSKEKKNLITQFLWEEAKCLRRRRTSSIVKRKNPNYIKHNTKEKIFMPFAKVLYSSFFGLWKNVYKLPHSEVKNIANNELKRRELNY